MKINKIIFLILLCVVSIFIFTNKSYADDFKDGDKIQFTHNSYIYEPVYASGTVNSLLGFEPKVLGGKKITIKEGVTGYYVEKEFQGLPIEQEWFKDKGLCYVEVDWRNTDESEPEIVAVKKANIKKDEYIDTGTTEVRVAKEFICQYYGDGEVLLDSKVFEKMTKENLKIEYNLAELIKQELNGENIKKEMEKYEEGHYRYKTLKMKLDSLQKNGEAMDLKRKAAVLKNMIETEVKNRGMDVSELLDEEAQQKAEEKFKELQGIVDKKQDAEENHNGKIYYQPDKVGKDSTSGETIDSLIGNAQDFTESAKDGAIGSVEAVELQNFSKVLYNILLSVGVAAAVIVGAILGIKIMTAGVEEKAEVKELLIPYVVACVIIFGGFGIWKLVVEILSGV